MLVHLCSFLLLLEQNTNYVHTYLQLGVLIQFDGLVCYLVNLFHNKKEFCMKLVCFMSLFTCRRFKTSLHCVLFPSDFHDVKKAKVGLPVPHDAHSYETINWKVRNIRLQTCTMQL